MDKRFKNKLYLVIVLLMLFVILLPDFSRFFNYKVYGVAPGTEIIIPTGIEQYGAQYEKEDISWIPGTGQEAVNKIWVSQGKPADNNNWAYITVGGQKRYLVAMSQTFGEPGDYVDIHLRNGKVYPCILGDVKRNHEPAYPDNTEQGAFVYNGVSYGHYYSGKCSVVELILKDYSKTPSTSILNSMKPVEKVVNGGSCLNGDAPVGLDATYVTVGVSVGSQDEWLKALEDITNEMLSDGGWIYSNSNNITDYTEAKKDSPKRTNCALMVSHALQYFGAFETNMSFYGKDDGSIVANSKTTQRLDDIADITDYKEGEMTIDKADLQPGDIVTYYGQHTNVYKGVDESGVKVWYDAGRQNTAEGKSDSKFTTFTRTTNDIGMSISHIIRLKYNTEITEQERINGGESESKTFAGAVGSFFRDQWAAFCSLFENLKNERDDITVLYSFKNVDDNNSYFGEGNRDLVLACEAVTKMLLARGCYYSLDTQNQLISGDIKRQLTTGKYFCCATYVAAALYYSGLLTESQINSYNYHWTGDGGIPSMLQAAGWKQIPASQAQPGDVVNDYTVHVMVYAGDGKVWDQTSAVTSSQGTPPTGTTRSYDLSRCQIWRAP